MSHWLLSLVLVLAGLPAPAQALDLLERYPTGLTAGDTAANHARPWEFSTNDVFQLDRFSFQVGQNLRVETGPADLGIGHCQDGAVWAVVLPRTGGTLTRPSGEPEEIAHVWLRFHPRELNRLFPPTNVAAVTAASKTSEIRAIANAKFGSSWHAGWNAMIPEPKDLAVDVDTRNGPRRFFSVDVEARAATYRPAFERQALKPPPAITPELAGAAFDQLWQAFDRDYAMFALRPELDWAAARELFRPRAVAADSTYALADVCAELLKPLRDLHVWLTLAGAEVPVFNRPRAGNSNPSAHRALLGSLQANGRVRWTVTPDQIGFLAIDSWNAGAEIPNRCGEALEAMRNTRGLIVDVRLNGGGDEPTAAKVAGRFLTSEFVYAFSQYRNGPAHTNLTRRYPRTIAPTGPWTYARPVVLLIGQRCMSSCESFVGMMTGAPQVTTLGAPTCGSSGNPRRVQLPLDLAVSVPRWIDYLPDGTPLDERGFQPQIPFDPKPGAFEGQRDDLLAAALDRLRALPLPTQPIEGPVFVPDAANGATGSGRPR